MEKTGDGKVDIKNDEVLRRRGTDRIVMRMIKKWKTSWTCCMERSNYSTEEHRRKEGRERIRKKLTERESSRIRIV